MDKGTPGRGVLVVGCQSSQWKREKREKQQDGGDVVMSRDREHTEMPVAPSSRVSQHGLTRGQA